MAFAKGPMEGHGTWAKKEALERSPGLVCRKHYAMGIKGFVVWDGDRPLGSAESAREAWVKAVGALDRRDGR